MPGGEGLTPCRQAASDSRQDWLRALERTAAIARHPTLTLPCVVLALAEKFGDAPALLDEMESLSYRALAARVNRYSRWALANGLSAGGVAAIYVPNCPDYMALWLGITRVGGVAALINTSLVGDSLRHAVTIAAPRHLIVGAPFAEAFATLRPALAPEIRCWAHRGPVGDLPRLDREIEHSEDGAIDDARFSAPHLDDRALLIYTSGTMGLPKAANVSHHRIMQWSHWFAGLMDTRPDDRMYNCLPMYHSTGGIVATGATLLGGGSVLIRPRFSAGRFWEEIAAWDCTLFQYIGELCRYLAARPPDPQERAHRLRLCCGNGLRGDIWTSFQGRFGVPRILEFYAATEGNFALYNCDGEPGSLGRIPAFLGRRFPVALLRLDPASGEPLRDAAGFCVPCGAEEAGEAIGRIDERSGSSHRFEGYAEAGASARKILRHVFAPGDAWLRTGDLLRQDRRGFFYFVDRLGDSFRWKGENVSSQEVAAVIAACPGVTEAVVYGVAIPGAEGRAGMAAIVAGRGFDTEILRQHLAAHLPDHAQPLFWRFCATLEATATFKPRKHALQQEGYDPAAVGDPIFLDDRQKAALVPFDAALYGRIQSGTLRL